MTAGLRTRLFGLFFVAMATAAAVVTGGPADAAVPFQYIVAHGSNTCLDIATENGAILQLYHCTGVSEQTWNTSLFSPANGWFEFQNQRYGKCIGAIHSGPGTPGGPGVLGPVEGMNCTGIDSQTPWDKWKVQYAFNPGDGTGWYQVWSNLGDVTKCLSRTGPIQDRVSLDIEPCNPSSPSQQWTFKDI